MEHLDQFVILALDSAHSHFIVFEDRQETKCSCL